MSSDRDSFCSVRQPSARKARLQALAGTSLAHHDQNCLWSTSRQSNHSKPAGSWSSSKELRIVQVELIEVAHPLLGCLDAPRTAGAPSGAPRHNSTRRFARIRRHEEAASCRDAPTCSRTVAGALRTCAIVSGRLIHERALSMHDLVVRERQQEALRVLVEHGERDGVVQVPSMESDQP